MKIVHLLLEGASRYDHVCADVDSSSEPGGPSHELFGASGRALTGPGAHASFRDLARRSSTEEGCVLHIHGSASPPRSLLAHLDAPWVSDRPLELPRALFRKIPAPAAVLVDRDVPDAVPDEWFVRGPRVGRPGGRVRVGSYVRSAATRNNTEQAIARIERFRDDVVWTAYQEPPTPEEMASLDLWVDPAAGDEDLDGMAPEAMACLTPVVASRTKQNIRRLDDGRAGALIPVGDPNELTHAVLNVLFKEEVAAPFRAGAERSRERFRAHHRRHAVNAIYEEVLR